MLLTPSFLINTSWFIAYQWLHFLMGMGWFSDGSDQNQGIPILIPKNSKWNSIPISFQKILEFLFLFQFKKLGILENFGTYIFWNFFGIFWKLVRHCKHAQPFFFVEVSIHRNPSKRHRIVQTKSGKNTDQKTN